MLPEFSYLSTIILFSWVATTSWIGLGSILTAGLILFSTSVANNILLLILLTIFSFLIASGRGRKELAGTARWYYSVRLLLLFMAMFGAALEGHALSPLIIFIGLLLSLPLFFWSIIFSRHFESLTTRGYLYSVIIPALATISLLLRIKTDMKAEWNQTWDILLTVTGLATLLTGTTLSFLKKKTKALAIYLTQAWIGLSLFVLVVDSEPLMHIALAALSCFTVTGPLLLILAKQTSPRTERFARVMLLGMPGFLGFSTFHYTVRSISALNVYWLWVIAVAFLIQVLSLMVNQYSEEVSGDKWIRARFFIVVGVQLICATALFFYEKGGRL